MIAIVGAGITGLYLGKLLKDNGVNFRLYEAGDKVGGNMKTIREGAYQYETGPNSLRMNADFAKLIDELHLRTSLEFTSSYAKKRFILKDGRYRAAPSGPQDLLLGTFLGRGLVRKLLRERKLPAMEIEGESVDGFFRRRFGDKVADYLVTPFISGIYAGDPKALLVDKAFPKIKHYERAYGSVLRGFIKGRKKSKGGPKGIFSFREGLGQLSEALAEHIGTDLHLNTSIERLEKVGDGWRIYTANNSFDAEQVVLALPACKIAGLVEAAYPNTAAALNAVHYPPVSVVVSVYKREAVRHRLDGFGALHNRIEPSHTLGTIFSSSLFPQRCPVDEVMLTTFVGGTLNPDNALAEDERLRELVNEDHTRFLGAQQLPVFQRIIRWPRAIPQYNSDIVPAHQHAEMLASEGLHCGGNWMHGISVPSCLEHAQKLCAQLLQSAPTN